MGIRADQIRTSLIRPVLQRLGSMTPCKHSEAAENLLMGTAATESLMGEFIRQHPTGPARGIFQIETPTAQSILDNFVRFRPAFQQAIDVFMTQEPLEQQLITNLALQTVIARLVYYPKPQPLPAADDIPGLGQYWKTHYNTTLGAGTVQKFVDDYARYVR
jgi:hypothetical protein